MLEETVIFDPRWNDSHKKEPTPDSFELGGHKEKKLDPGALDEMHEEFLISKQFVPHYHTPSEGERHARNPYAEEAEDVSKDLIEERFSGFYDKGLRIFQAAQALREEAYILASLKAAVLRSSPQDAFKCTREIDILLLGIDRVTEHAFELFEKKYSLGSHDPDKPRLAWNLGQSYAQDDARRPTEWAAAFARELTDKLPTIVDELSARLSALLTALEADESSQLGQPKQGELSESTQETVATPRTRCAEILREGSQLQEMLKGFTMKDLAEHLRSAVILDTRVNSAA
jgi:hypothetical protein